MRAGGAALSGAVWVGFLAGGCQIDNAADDPGQITVTRAPKRDAGASVAMDAAATPTTMAPPAVPQPPAPPAPAPVVPPPVDAAVPLAAQDAAVAPVDLAAAPPPDLAPAPPPQPPDASPPAPPDVAPSALPPLTPGSWWRPTVGLTWDWQLKVPINASYDVQVYDIDLFENDAQVVADLHRQGRKVICYVNLGAWENWRADADRFPREIIGAPYHGFPDENWLDIRQLAVLAPLVRSRLDMARNKGCDAVEPDNVDGWDVDAHEPTGFPITYEDQLAYNRFIAAEAHARGLGVGLKNDVHQVKDLLDDFDFHVSEQCYEYKECPLLMPFISAGKPVFLAEYSLPLTAFCAEAKAARISAIRKTNDLDAFREVCP